jgi:hypothetical protein
VDGKLGVPIVRVTVRALREAPRALTEVINGRLLLNSGYRQVPEIRVAYAVEVPDRGQTKQESMYELIEEPSLFEFLTAPERHTDLFQTLYNR